MRGGELFGCGGPRRPAARRPTLMRLSGDRAERRAPSIFVLQRPVISALNERRRDLRDRSWNCVSARRASAPHGDVQKLRGRRLTARSFARKFAMRASASLATLPSPRAKKARLDAPGAHPRPRGRRKRPLVEKDAIDAELTDVLELRRGALPSAVAPNLLVHEGKSKLDGTPYTRPTSSASTPSSRSTPRTRACTPTRCSRSSTGCSRGWATARRATRSSHTARRAAGRRTR